MNLLKHVARLIHPSSSSINTPRKLGQNKTQFLLPSSKHLDSKRFSIEFVNPSTTLIRVGLVALLAATSMESLIYGSVAVAQTSNPSSTMAQIPLGSTVIYVNPGGGNDAPNAGSTENTPYRTITYALKQAQPGMVVQLARGSYTKDSGEVFPLVVPTGVILRGSESDRGAVVAIVGGGNYISKTFAGQNVTILANSNTEIRGVLVTNPYTRGTGIWVESSNPTIENCTFTNNNREGVFVTGTGNPRVLNNTFFQNGGNGISIASNAKGEIRDNIFQKTGFGLAIGGDSAPLVSGNRITENVDGIYINDRARPVLRGNVIENNARDGVVATIKAQPDLGNADGAGNNAIRNNRQYDLNNSTGGTLYSVGNTLDPNRIAGKVEFVAPAGGSQSAFRDVQGHWAQSYIEALAKREIISGFPDGTFRPSDPVTRVQFAAIINKAFAPTATQSGAEFRDVAKTFWGYGHIQSVVRGGFMKGYPEAMFKPDQRIPRVQVLVALATGLSYGMGDANVLAKYQDATQIPTWAVNAVAAATQRKVVVNYPTLSQLGPNREATRAEVAAFVYQALVNAGKAEAIPSPYIVSQTGQ